MGHSVRLAKRLAGRSNPIGWFTSEVWDRLTDRTLWLNQQALKHIKDISNVILYLVNASESPCRLRALRQRPKWKSLLGLINDHHPIEPNGRDSSAGRRKQRSSVVEDFLSTYKFIVAVLPLDAFARCWAQEYRTLGCRISKALTPTPTAAFTSLREGHLGKGKTGSLLQLYWMPWPGYLVKLS